MKTVICVEKDDIFTCRLGKNILVDNKNNLISISFTEEALEELINDYKSIKEKETKNV